MSTNPLKKLAGETAIYGLSTILARMLNFFLVPIYSRVLELSEYGSLTDIMAYVAVLQVVMVLGLETGCFKFANNSNNLDNPDKPFSNALITVGVTAIMFFLIIWAFSEPIAVALDYAGYSNVMIYVGGLIALDSITAIMFARLRFQQKALKFAVLKSIKILSEVIFNLIFLFGAPLYFLSHPQSVLLNFIPATPDFSYIILAIFVSCIICFLLFIPDFLKMRFSFNKKLWWQMIIYSIPLMIAGLPGIINEFLDRILFRYFAPSAIDWREALGEYQAAVKLAVIMSLFIQMFRYAAEPFFFAKGKNKDLLAQVMEYFVAFCMFIFLGIVFYIDIIGLLLGKDFRGALGTVPFMLISYMLIGILFNVSMWYKLSGQTKYAINITFIGLLVTAAINICLMPLISYWASVWAHILSGLAMLIYSIYLGNKYYPIPYDWYRILVNIVSALILFVISLILREMLLDKGYWIVFIINTLLLGVYLLFVKKYTLCKLKL